MQHKAGDILTKAAIVVEAKRANVPGSRARTFNAIEGLWNAYLAARKDASAPLTAPDVAIMLSLSKIAKAAQADGVQLDHYVDGVGYVALAGEMAARDDPTPTTDEEAIDAFMSQSASKPFNEEADLSYRRFMAQASPPPPEAPQSGANGLSVGDATTDTVRVSCEHCGARY